MNNHATEFDLLPECKSVVCNFIGKVAFLRPPFGRSNKGFLKLRFDLTQEVTCSFSMCCQLAMLVINSVLP